jgi:dihydrofolate reductase
MAKLIYSAITSLDGFTADASGNFDWAVPDDEVHAFVNELDRPIGTYLYGRGMYDVMRDWETAEDQPDQTPTTLDYAQIWRSADKMVFSTTLASAPTARTRIERDFDLDAVRQMKAAAEHDLSIGGPGLAAHALRAGLVDEIHLFLTPVVVGGGTPALPDGVRLKLELLDERRFASGVIYVHYATTP